MAPNAEGTAGQVVAGWFTDPVVRRRILVEGFVIFLVAAILSIVLVGAVLFELTNLVKALLTGLGGGSATHSATGVPTNGFSDAAKIGAQLLLGLWSFFFFTGHLSPYAVTITGGLNVQVSGVGPTTIALVSAVLAYRSGRRLEIQVPSGSHAMAAGRAAVVAIPMLLGSVVIWALGKTVIDLRVVSVEIAPATLGVATPTLVVAAFAACGALAVRPSRVGLGEPYAVREGLGAAIGSLLTGLVFMVALALVALAITSVTAHAAGPTFPTQSLSPGTPGEKSPDLSAIWAGLAIIVPFYIPNAAGWGWANSFQLTNVFSSAYGLVALAPVAAAVAGAARLAVKPDPVRQASYALALVAGTLVLTLGGEPNTGTAALGPPLWQPVVIMAALAAVAAFAAPYLPGVARIRALTGIRPVAWLFAAGQWLCAPERQAAISATQTLDDSHEDAGRHLPLSHRQGLSLIGVALLIVAGVGTNITAASVYSPQNSAVDFLHAEADDNVNAAWGSSAVSVGSAAGAPTMSKAALAAMLKMPENRPTDVQVKSVAQRADGDYDVAVSYKMNGTVVSRSMRVRRDTAHSRLLFYPAWTIDLVPATLNVQAFRNAGAIRVDGIEVPISGTSSTISVIPGWHRVTVDATAVTAADDQSVDTSSGSGTVTFKPTFKPGAQTAALNTIRSEFERCAATTQLRPTNCPQSEFALGDTQKNVKWSLIGDPTANVNFTLGNQADTITGTGQFRMSVSYDYSYSFGYASHQTYQDSGPFTAVLRANSSGGFDVVSFTRYGTGN